MGKINNYTVDTPNPGDKILASDAFDNETKNITAQSVADLGRSSKVYRAFLTQAGTSAPTAVLVPGNTITGTWSYDNVGEYIFTASDDLGTKTSVILSLNSVDAITYTSDQTGTDTIEFKSYDTATLADDVISNLFIEITTYDL